MIHSFAALVSAYITGSRLLRPERRKEGKGTCVICMIGQDVGLNLRLFEDLLQI